MATPDIITNARRTRIAFVALFCGAVGVFAAGTQTQRSLFGAATDPKAMAALGSAPAALAPPAGPVVPAAPAAFALNKVARPQNVGKASNVSNIVSVPEQAFARNDGSLMPVPPATPLINGGAPAPATQSAFNAVTGTSSTGGNNFSGSTGGSSGGPSVGGGSTGGGGTSSTSTSSTSTSSTSTSSTSTSSTSTGDPTSSGSTSSGGEGVPEPSTWLMLVGGFLALGGAMRVRAGPALGHA